MIDVRRSWEGIEEARFGSAGACAGINGTFRQNLAECDIRAR